MIHSRIKCLHTEEDTTTKQKTIRSHNTISGEDSNNKNRQRKRECFDKGLPKVKLCRNRPKGQCCSLISTTMCLIGFNKLDWTECHRISESTTSGNSFTAGLFSEQRSVGVLEVTWYVVSSFVWNHLILEWIVVHYLLFLCSISFCMYVFHNFPSSSVDKFSATRLKSISSALALPVSRGRHVKLIDNFSHESDITSLKNPF